MRAPLRQVLQQEKPDLVVCHNLSGWSVAAWDEIRASGVPIVQVLHDMYLLCPKNTLFKKGQSCQKLCGSCAALRRPHAEQSPRWMPSSASAVPAGYHREQGLLQRRSAPGHPQRQPDRRQQCRDRDPQSGRRRPLRLHGHPVGKQGCGLADRAVSSGCRSTRP